MTPAYRLLVAAFVCAAAATAACGQPAAETPATPSDDARQFAGLVWSASDTVLNHHVNPPTRQQMILAGLKASLDRSDSKDSPTSGQLSRSVSALSSEQELKDYLHEAWEAWKVPAESAADVRNQFIRDMFAIVEGRPNYIAANEYKVHRQLRDNLYEGIGIAIGYDPNDQMPVINTTFPRGPARLAGAKRMDRIVSVDGQPTHTRGLRAAIDMLRGEKGTPVEIVVQQPGTAKKRTLKMTRGVIPFDTVLGARQTEDERWSYTVPTEERIGYIKIGSIRGSTPHELRTVARTLEAQGARALIVDLRGTRPGDLRHTVMLADALIDRGVIGQVRDSAGTEHYESKRDCLFRNWPIAVLIDGSTQRDAEWLAAALKDSGRATLVGQHTAGQGFVEATIQLDKGSGAVALLSGAFHRADGRSLVQPRPTTVGPSPVNLRRDIPGGAAPKEVELVRVVHPDHVVSAASRAASGNSPKAKAIEILRDELDNSGGQ